MTATTTRSQTFSQRQKLRRWAIRNQARLEAGTADHWIPYAFSLVLAAALIYLSLARVDGLLAGLDLAGYTQAVWLIGDGQAARPSLFGSNVHVLELHWSFILYPLALPGLVFPVAKMLLVVQSVALAVAVVPIWLLARKVAKLRIGAATALVLAYALHPATHAVALEDFHPVSLAIPALIGMAYFGATKQFRWFWACVFFVLLCRADLGLAVAVWGLIVTAQSERRVGLWAVGVGLVWFFGFLLIAQPITGQPGAAGGYAGGSLGEILLDALREPGAILGNLVAEVNVALVIALLAPLIFLPLLSIRHLSAGLTVVVLSFVVDTPADISMTERSAALLAFSMVAATFAFKRLGNRGVDRVFLDPRLLTALGAAAVLMSLSTSPASPYREPWQWNTPTEQSAAVMSAIEQVPAGAAVRASPAAVTHLAERTWVFDLETDGELSVTETAFPDFLNAILIVDETPSLDETERRESFNTGMQSLGFRLRINDPENGVRLYVR